MHHTYSSKKWSGNNNFKLTTLKWLTCQHRLGYTQLLPLSFFLSFLLASPFLINLDTIEAHLCKSSLRYPVDLPSSLQKVECKLFCFKQKNAMCTSTNHCSVDPFFFLSCCVNLCPYIHKCTLLYKAIAKRLWGSTQLVPQLEPSVQGNAKGVFQLKKIEESHTHTLTTHF